MPNPTEYRTDFFDVNWLVETQWGVVLAQQATNRFGLHDVATLPDPDLGWRSFYGVGSGRNRTGILRGRWDLRGSIPDIELQGMTAIFVLSLLIGTVVQSTTVPIVFSAIEGQGLGGFDQRLTSFTLVATMYDTAHQFTFIRYYTGGKVNRATVFAREGDSLRLTLDEMIFRDIAHNIVANSLVPGGAAVDKSSPNLQPGFGVPLSVGRYMFAGGEVSFGSVPICALREFSLSVDNQLAPRYYICLNAGDPFYLSQIINALQEGKRIYTMNVGIDVLNGQTDLVLFEYLMDQSAAAGHTSPSLGFQVGATFFQAPGDSFSLVTGFGASTAPLAIVAANSISTTFPGTVVKGGKINLPAPPVGVIGADYVLDTSSVIFVQYP